MHPDLDNAATGAAQPDRDGREGGRHKLNIVEVLLKLWRSRSLIFLVFLSIFILAVLLANQLSKEFTAYSRIQVSLGSDYVYDPVVSDAGRGATLDPDSVVQAEIEKAYSPVIQRRVLETVGVTRLFPDIAEAMKRAGTPEKRLAAEQSALEALETGFSVGHTPKSPVVRFSFTHKDPQVAADATNAFVKAFLTYRKEVSTGYALSAVSAQRREFDANLADAEASIREFLVKHQIGDFDSEKAAAATRRSALTDDLNNADAGMHEAEGRLKSLESQLKDVNPEIDLYVETTGDQQLLDLQVEREQLLARYKPGSQPVKEIDARIANLRQLLQAAEGGVRRRGPNPAYQDMRARLTQLRSDVEASRSRSAEVRRQLKDVETRQQLLIRIEPEYQRLVRARDALAESAKALAKREQSTRAENEMSSGAYSSVRVLEKAYPPSKGKSLKMPAAIAGFLFAGVTALMAGLLRAFSSRTLATRGAAQQVLGLPVLSAVPHHRTPRARA